MPFAMCRDQGEGSTGYFPDRRGVEFGPCRDGLVCSVSHSLPDLFLFSIYRTDWKTNRMTVLIVDRGYRRVRNRMGITCEDVLFAIFDFFTSP